MGLRWVRAGYFARIVFRKCPYQHVAIAHPDCSLRCFLIRSFQAYSIAYNNRRTHPAVARPAATIGAATRELQFRLALIAAEIELSRRTAGTCRLCCKSLKTPGDKFPARRRNKPRSLIDVASGSLPKSPVSLSPGDEVS